MDYHAIKTLMQSRSIEDQYIAITSLIEQNKFWGFGAGLTSGLIPPRHFKPKTATEFLVVNFYLPNSENDDWFSERRNFDAHFFSLRSVAEDRWGFEWHNEHFKKNDPDRFLFRNMPYKAGIRCVAVDIAGRPNLSNGVYLAGSEVFTMAYLFPDLLGLVSSLCAGGYLLKQETGNMVPELALSDSNYLDKCLSVKGAIISDNYPLVTVRELQRDEY